MRKLFLEALQVMEAAFRRLEFQVPPPQWERHENGERVRYTERTINQAMIQKLARHVSGLYALDVLLLNGLTQEQGVMKRVLGDLEEDIKFLSHAVLNGEITQHHEAFLSDFWAEEFDHPEPIRATQKRKTVRREKVHAHNARASGAEDVHTVKEISATLQKTYSGYVHAASHHIMDMCGGDPPRFYFRVPRSDPITRDYVEDAWNYFYRGIMAFALVAAAFGDQKLFNELREYMKKFENDSGKTYDGEERSLAPR